MSFIHLRLLIAGGGIRISVNALFQWVIVVFAFVCDHLLVGEKNCLDKTYLDTVFQVYYCSGQLNISFFPAQY